MRSRKSLSFHESAHVVALYALGHRAALVTILPGPEGTAGHVKPLYDLDAADKDAPAFYKQVLISKFIGQVAEASFLDASDAQTIQYVADVGADDTDKVKEVAVDLEKAGFDREQCKKEALDEAIKLAEKHWPAIRELAGWLQKKETLLGLEITLILDPYKVSAV